MQSRCCDLQLSGRRESSARPAKSSSPLTPIGCAMISMKAATRRCSRTTGHRRRPRNTSSIIMISSPHTPGLTAECRIPTTLSARAGCHSTIRRSAMADIAVPDYTKFMNYKRRVPRLAELAYAAARSVGYDRVRLRRVIGHEAEARLERRVFYCNERPGGCHFAVGYWYQHVFSYTKKFVNKTNPKLSTYTRHSFIKRCCRKCANERTTV